MRWANFLGIVVLVIGFAGAANETGFSYNLQFSDFSQPASNIVDNGINMIFVKVENTDLQVRQEKSGIGWRIPGASVNTISSGYMTNIMEIMFKIGEWQKRFPNKKLILFASHRESIHKPFGQKP